jgi:hypothetical protein
MTEYERFGLVFTKTRVYKFGHRSDFCEKKKFWVMLLHFTNFKDKRIQNAFKKRKTFFLNIYQNKLYFPHIWFGPIKLLKSL